MHLHLVFMLYSCLLVFVYLFSIFVLFFFQKKKFEKCEKYKNCMFVYIGTCVPLDGH